jgi:hypothetical protein
MGDLALKMMGVACAAGSVWFAAHMFTHQEGGPRINAMEDFAIFAQPNRIHAVEAAVRAAADSGAARKTGRAIAIDMTPIGVAASHPAANAGPARPDRNEDIRQDLRISALSDSDALLETPEGYRRVAIGDEIPEIGKIIAIRRLDDYWILVGSLRSLAQVALPPEGGVSRAGVRP